MGAARYTDQEMAVISDRSVPAPEAADQVGVSAAAVYRIRQKIEKGTLHLSDWIPAETDFILEHFDTMTMEQMAAFLGRTYDQVHSEVARLRKKGIVAPRPKRSMNPGTVAGRHLLAKTCPKCGLLLDARWFNRSHNSAAGGKATYQQNCRKCETGRSSEAMQRRRGLHEEYVAKLQEYTLERAENNGNEWTAKDVQVLSDPGKTTFEKALELKRTYSATCTALHKHGLTSKPDFAQMDKDAWRLFWEFDFDLETAS